MVKNINEIDFKRTITHTSYKHGDKKVKKGGPSRMLEQHITDNKQNLNNRDVSENEAFYPANENFLKFNVPYNETVYWGGGFFTLMLLIIIVGGFKFPDEIFSLSFLLPLFITIAGLIFFVIYYFTMPKKECIFNRRDGLLTFPGFYWRPNITMPIKEVIFSMTSPSAQGLGAYMLEIVRPDKTYSLFLCTLGKSCYEDLSFFLWYMDKNRPLPPGDAFDEYRQKDFERRKAAGFPKPMFPSRFPTPEATAEQQAQRERIGGW